MSEEIDDIVRDFVIDTYENLVRIDRDLVELETHPQELEIITRVFRAIHTIKGVCGFLSYNKLREVCHAGESLLSCLRDQRLVFTPEVASALLGMVDSIRQILACIENERNEGAGDYSGLIANLTRLYESAPPVDSSAPQPARARNLAAIAAAVAGAAAPPPPAAAPPVPAPAVVAAPEAGDKSGWDRGIRVDIELLDKLMTLVGELVLARNQIVQISGTAATAHVDTTKLMAQTTHTGRILADATQRLDSITTELQEGVMKTRMQPIGVIWSRYPRMVRDLGIACGKEVRVDMEGMETELDKTLIEAIKDPLTHLVRNSVDHGIEYPGAREAAGKSREGHLRLNAYHAGGFVNIEISDDGAGVNFERVRAKAVKSGLLSADHAARLGYKDVMNLLFLPGFSTAERVTDISGRGVGMDVVKTNIERIGGTIDIDTTQGAGTTITVKVPLTLAIIPALMIDSGGERFAIPQSSLVELLRLDREYRSGRIEMMHGTPVYRLRKRLLPLVFLHDLLGMGADASLGNDAAMNIVVLQSGGHTFGLVVDAVRDTEEIVVKPLGQQLQHLACYGGATILGDGRIALILEVLGLAQEANIGSKLEEAIAEDNAAHAEAEAVVDESRSVLLFYAGDVGHIAVPLDKITRLEAFPRSVVEVNGGQYVVQYRGDILRLVRLEDALPGYTPPPSDSDLMHVLVYSNAGRSIGLIIGRILDIMDTPVKVQQALARPGVAGSAIMLGRITEFLDVEYLVRSVDPGFFVFPEVPELPLHA